ncbi:type II toxin-antitoxin system VapC family toxin [Leptospira gomenensis]|uniref:Ribonuclease VapC n=1 Tax=Leptospira gomenensis TaxID=2484974 RepID=A0A5F1Y999_9LEPT|nr:type II toxin-antitoxin system VapC family toxin [Leptospira gomenensis]TGK36825.1 type II toxin-antitoxin system VapC family toxin [Leptospira gomenensis]TGK39900.1 type II toxin-antitoxin system VapC family toxin [Leptospira gomenensis]TGK58035.1 type II toxin-antitoxin system VapC family toxin [Leptospira gomenensis]
MIVDTSALLAILLQEEEQEKFVLAIISNSNSRMSVANYLEAAVRTDRLKDPVLSRLLDDALAKLKISLEPVTVEQIRLAREAYKDFGKGSGHPAGLNFGDCFAYALAKDQKAPLLFKGEDFLHTDVERAKAY